MVASQETLARPSTLNLVRRNLLAAGCWLSALVASLLIVPALRGRDQEGLTVLLVVLSPVVLPLIPVTFWEVNRSLFARFRPLVRAALRVLLALALAAVVAAIAVVLFVALGIWLYGV